MVLFPGMKKALLTETVLLLMLLLLLLLLLSAAAKLNAQHQARKIRRGAIAASW